MDVLTNLEHKNHLNFLFGRSGVVVEKGKTYLYTVRPKKKTWKLFFSPSFFLSEIESVDTSFASL